MRSNTFILILLIQLTFSVQSSFAQSNWMIAEKLSGSNRWNRPFFTRLNSVAALDLNNTNGEVYCKDCSVPSILFNAVTSNVLASYQVNKAQTLASVTMPELNKKYADYLKSIQKPWKVSLEDAIHTAEIVLYRRTVTSTPNNLKELPVEWIALELKDTSIANKKINAFRIYMRAADCFNIMDQSGCEWTHAINRNYTSSYTTAINNRNYLVQEYSIVSVQTLQVIPDYVKKEKMPTLAYNLLVNDPNKSHGMLANENSDHTSVHLFAVCRADIREQKNLGYYKVHTPALLIDLFLKDQLKGYTYHEDGHFSALLKEDLTEQLIVEVETDSDLVLKPLLPDELYSLQILKELTKENASITVKNEWLILGTAPDQSTAFHNKYTIAFRFEDVIHALSTHPRMWFNGTNQHDSVRLDEALRTQRIAYNEMFVYTVYSDTILHVTSDPVYTEVKYEDRLSQLLNLFTPALISDYDGANRRLLRTPKVKTTSYLLTYYFDKPSNTFLTRNSACTDLLLKAIKEKKLSAYEDPDLKRNISSADVLYKLDKSRFYKTGNAKKDSIYISTLSDSARYISTELLTEFYLHSTYVIQDGKEKNNPTSFGIVIPSDQNPQYDTETLCYVSFAAFQHYASQSKEYKKYASQLSSLQNEKQIIRVTDFYDVLLYEYSEDEIYITTREIPSFIMQHAAGR